MLQLGVRRPCCCFRSGASEAHSKDVGRVARRGTEAFTSMHEAGSEIGRWLIKRVSRPGFTSATVNVIDMRAM